MCVCSYVRYVCVYVNMIRELYLCMVFMWCMVCALCMNCFDAMSGMYVCM